MEQVNGTIIQRIMTSSGLAKAANQNRPVVVCGQVHALRHMGQVTFLILRLSDGLLQCVLNQPEKLAQTGPVREEAAARVSGLLRQEERAPGGIELHLDTLELLSLPQSPRPFALTRKLDLSVDAQLNWRPLLLRHQRERDIFRLQEGLCRGFRDFLHRQDFTEIHTPKIVSAGAEGGSNIFRLDYFGQKAFLAQSPQFYKQTMVGVFGRVFEVGPVFRAEKHNTVRHLNEYTSLDFEMGFIDSFHDIMNMETALLQATLQLLNDEYRPELTRLGIRLPPVAAIPLVRFDEAKKQVSERHNRRSRDPNDLEPEEERLISEWIAAEYGSDFVFVTHYPSAKRPFYAMDDPADPRYTLSFDLLFHGIEVTTGGQRIHDYQAQVEKMQARGLDPQAFASYLMIHEYGMPPHGGLGIGLERLLMALLGAGNIRQAALFPRDLRRLDP